jgi:signal transduction histidine kinase
MPEVIWYRSLYWRIAFGFVAVVATLLAVQGLVFLWMTGQMTDIFPTRSPAQFASALASDVGAVLVEQPEVDLRAHVLRTYSSPYRSYVVALADGRTVVSERVPPPAPLVRSARTRLLVERGEGAGGGRGGRGGGRPPRSGGPGRDDTGGAASANGPGGSTPSAVERRPEGTRPRGNEPDSDRGSGPGRFFGRGGFLRGGGDGVPGGTEYARVLQNGVVIGMVAVPREAAPLSVALRALGPTLAIIALGLLTAGTAVAALVIFRPTRRRLSQLQDAARAIGAGHTGVRAPETGGDEVTSLSRAFNEMAVELEQRTTALETADRTRRQLLADVSHELMTPLAAIRGYVETLQMTGLKLDDAARDRYLRIVNDESERLEQIIGDLLDLARLDGGGGSFRDDDVSLSQLFERIRHRHEHALTERDITLVTAGDREVGPLRGDQNRLEQALQNLVANAIRHTPSSGTVTVTARRDDETCVLTVEDSGSGIPDEHLGRVFDRFYKVDESRTGTVVPSGSGLGLSIVQAIVHRHQGTILASNVAGGGARFEIRLPLRRPDSPAIG